jgi:rubrerythrin
MTKPPPTTSAARALVAFLTSHEAREEETLAGYRQLAEALPTAGLRYVARLILSDEQRHHQFFGDLSETVLAFEDLAARGMPVPPISGEADPTARQNALQSLEQFIRLEQEEQTDLERLAADLKPSQETTLWSVIVQIMREDTERHIRLLEFMRTRLL